jgi:hypothetical protein
MVKRLCASMESTVLHEWMRGAHLIERDCRSTSWGEMASEFDFVGRGEGSF